MTASTAALVLSDEGHTAPPVPVLARGAIGLLRPLADVPAMMEAQRAIREYVKQILRSGVDYAVVPGTDRQGKGKPSLMKAGAEKVNLAFGLTPEFTIVEQTIDHTGEYPWVKRKWEWGEKKGEKVWSEEKGIAYGLYRFVTLCRLRHRESGVVVAECIGVCSTMESKYCDRPRECENTALKMSQKRAMVGASLLAAGLSDEFTQDIEDFKDGANMGADAEDAGGAETAAADVPACPKCTGAMWDNRVGKKNPKAPDFKCKDKGCDGVVWPPKPGEAKPEAAKAPISTMTVDQAKALPFPFQKGKASHGKPLDSFKTEMLQSVATWISEQQSEHGEGWHADTLHAIRMILKDREKDQTKLALDPAPTAATSATMPAAGRVADALAGDERPAALADDDDDLPF